MQKILSFAIFKDVFNAHGGMAVAISQLKAIATRRLFQTANFHLVIS